MVPNGNKRALLIGGYGRTGLNIAKTLLKETHLTIVLTGRDEAQARDAAQTLNDKYQCTRAFGVRLNTRDKDQLRNLFTTCDIIIVCIPFQDQEERTSIITSVLDSNRDYVDINVDLGKHALLRQLSHRIKEQKRVFVTDAGILPGLPAMLTKYLADSFDSIESVEIGCYAKDAHLPYGSAVDIISHIGQPAYLFEGKSWQKASLLTTRDIDFGSKLGKISCFPIYLKEMEQLPRQYHMNELGLYQGGVNCFVDGFLFICNKLKIKNEGILVRVGAKILQWLNNSFSRPPFGYALSFSAIGNTRKKERGCSRILLRYEELYEATAIPIVATMMQILDNDYKNTGHMMMYEAVEPQKMIRDMKQMGMEIKMENMPKPEWRATSTGAN